MISIGTAYFDPRHICESGQMFRFREQNGEYLLFSKNDVAKLVKFDGEYAIISSNEPYFVSYFDLGTDYQALERTVLSRETGEGQALLSEVFGFGRGMRILRQDPFETLVCFLISQNNHIPRIKSIVSRICEGLGTRREFEGESFACFPTAEQMAAAGEEFYRGIGAGYRAAYLQRSAERAAEIDFGALAKLSDGELAEEILKFPGVGPKVKDCILLFGFGRQTAFPVDTWIEKVYHEKFGGKETDRRKMTNFFEARFGGESGFVQQMLFYYARSNRADFARKNKKKLGDNQYEQIETRISL